MAELLDKFISEGRDQLGTSESPPNSNQVKYSKWYGLTGPWCAMFVSWVIDKVGLGDAVPKFAFTPSFAEWFKDHDQGFIKDAKARPGDIVFFNFPDSLDRIQHVGIVLSNANGRMSSLEGNTSGTMAGSQDDGGTVAIKTRGPNEAVYYGRIPELQGKVEEPEKRFKFPKIRADLRRGDTGADVKTLQIDLNRFSKWLDKHRDKATDFGAFELDVDGEFGKQTRKAVMTFQSWFNERGGERFALDVDGVAGKGTLNALDDIRDKQRDK
jgi:CHAP domain/Putative peptidoglycan binding domain